MGRMRPPYRTAVASADNTRYYSAGLFTPPSAQFPMPRPPLAIRFAILGALVLPAPAAFALAIEDVTGAWEIRSGSVFGQSVIAAPRKRLTLAVTNGSPLCLLQLGQNESIPITLERWESQGADQATVRITQLVPSGEVATYTVERAQSRELRFTATSGANSGQSVFLARQRTIRPPPAQPGEGGTDGQEAGSARQAATPAAKEAKAGLIARLTNDLALERKKLATAEVNLRNQLSHAEGAAGGRRAEYDAVVAERRDAVRLHRTRIDELCDKLEELGVDTGAAGKERRR